MRGAGWLLIVCLGLGGAARAARPTVEADVRAAEMVAAADRLALQGDQSGAVAKYRAIVRLYPQSHSAPRAQLQIADLLAANREHAEAFAAYQELIDKFPASSLFTPAIEGQFAIAQRVAESHRHADERGVKPPRTVPDRTALTTMLRQILGNGRHASFSAQLQYQLAVALDRAGERREAIGEFWRLLSTYPEDVRADDAAFQIAFIEYRQAREPNREQSSRLRAMQALDYFVAHFPGSEKVPEAQHLRVTLQQWGVTALEGAGDLYLRTGKTDAALRTYQEALQHNASEAEAAQLSERIESVRKRMR
jgi:outer membrane protein assembly factor BamD (BamD/ComL family)